jgi:hypothetical protein
MTTYQATKTVSTTRRALKATGERNAFTVNGQFVPAGAIVECGLFDAADLIARGLAVDATSDEVDAAGANIIIAPANGDSWKDVA